MGVGNDALDKVAGDAKGRLGAVFASLSSDI